MRLTRAETARILKKHRAFAVGKMERTETYDMTPGCVCPLAALALERGARGLLVGQIATALEIGTEAARAFMSCFDARHPNEEWVEPDDYDRGAILQLLVELDIVQ